MVLTPLNRGDSVIPNDLTKNLFDWGMQNPQEFADSLVRGIPEIPKVQSQHHSVNVQQICGTRIDTIERQ